MPPLFPFRDHKFVFWYESLSVLQINLFVVNPGFQWNSLPLAQPRAQRPQPRSFWVQEAQFRRAEEKQMPRGDPLGLQSRRGSALIRKEQLKQKVKKEYEAKNLKCAEEKNRRKPLALAPADTKDGRASWKGPVWIPGWGKQETNPATCGCACLWVQNYASARVTQRETQVMVVVSVCCVFVCLLLMKRKS